MVPWTQAQHNRLVELNAEPSALTHAFKDTQARNAAFREMERRLVQERRRELQAFRREQRRPGRALLEDRLIETLVADGLIELASGAMGPHPLDQAWRIDESWVGIGFGLERLLMAARGTANLKHMGRSLTYLNGIRLNI